MQHQTRQAVSMTRTQKMIFITMLVAQAMVLSVIEKMLPLNFAIPGAKLGLGNIITLSCIYLFPFKQTLAIIFLRTIMTSFIVGSPSTFLYSISGALVSFFVMYILIFIGREKISTLGISVVGGVFHNIGQLIVAMFIIKNARIFYYLPLLMITGVAAGIFVGVCVKYLLLYIKRLKYFNFR